MKATLIATVAGLAQGECCKKCTGQDQKYYSVDMKHGHCGETCVYPGQFLVYKAFEKNLTIADGSTGYTGCADLGWPKFRETVSHGDPLKLIVATLDLYDHNGAVSTPALEEPNHPSIMDAVVTDESSQANSMCCKTCPSGQKKYYSVDMKHGHCGETCIKPSQFFLFKAFEKNLTIADGSTGYTSCADLGWPKYSETVSHGDPLKLLVATLDLYNHDGVISAPASAEPTEASIALRSVEAGATSQASSMCCKTCPAGQSKYYSVDMKRGHCGESCIYPGKFLVFKVFEKNLTIADGSTGYTSCADLGWPKYRETVSHGDPLKLVVATLDLYDHSSLAAPSVEFV